MLGFTKEDYLKEIELGYLTRRVHPENDKIVILNYTPETTVDKHWNKVTMHCRGLILDESTGEILARPFQKFFNYGENPEYDRLINFNETPEFTVKQDGSLGISYRIDNKVYWSTRGSFTSEQAAVANEIWNTKYKDVLIPNELTLLVEIIDPRTRIVVDYKGQSDLVIIGAINRFTGYDYNYKELDRLGKELGMPVTPIETLTLDKALELKSQIDHNNEGWVLRWSNGLRLKIKGDKYMDIHRIAYGLSVKKKVEFWKENRLEELIQQVPEEFREEIQEIEHELNEIFKYIEERVISVFNQSPKDSRKEFALYIKNNLNPTFMGFAFKLFDGKDIDIDIKEHIYKYYDGYLGGGELLES